MLVPTATLLLSRYIIEFYPDYIKYANAKYGKIKHSACSAAAVSLQSEAMEGEIQHRAVSDCLWCCNQAAVKHLVATEKRNGICVRCTKTNMICDTYKALHLHRQEMKLTLTQYQSVNWREHVMASSFISSVHCAFHWWTPAGLSVYYFQKGLSDWMWRPYLKSRSSYLLHTCLIWCGLYTQHVYYQ